MRNVDVLARAIAIAEGYQDTSNNVLQKAPARRNNPGSLRASSFPNTNVNGYAVFPDAATGWKALYRQIGLDRDRRLTVAEFVFKFAPPTENRTAEYYLPLVLRETGWKATDRLDVLIEPFPPSSPVLRAGLPGVVDTPAPASDGPWPPPVVSGFALPAFLSSVGPVEIALAAIVFAGAVFLLGRE